MPENNDLNITQILRQFLLVMHHIKLHSRKRKFLMLRQILRPLLVIVPAHHIERRVRLHILSDFIYNLLRIDISAMNNRITLRNHGLHLIAQQSVRI